MPRLRISGTPQHDLSTFADMRSSSEESSSPEERKKSSVSARTEQSRRISRIKQSESPVSGDRSTASPGLRSPRPRKEPTEHVRRRKSATEPSNRKPIRQPSNGRHRRTQSDTTPWREVAGSLAKSVVNYALTVLAGAFHLASPLFSLGLCLLLLYVLGWYLMGLVLSPFSSLFRPLMSITHRACKFPGASVLPLCKHVVGGKAEYGDDLPPLDYADVPVIDFSNLMNAQSALESVVVDNQGFTALRHQMPPTARALKDLAAGIQYTTELSQAPELCDRLRDLSSHADRVTDDLLSLAGHVDRTTESISLRNGFTAEKISALQYRDQSRSRLSRVLAGWLPSPLVSVLLLDPPAGAAVRAVFLRHTDDVIIRVDHALAQAERVQEHLQVMDHDFESVAGLVLEAGIETRAERDRVVGSLFDRMLALVPASQSANVRAQFKDQLRLLEDVGRVQSAATAHVDRTILRLREVRARLESLGERVREAGWETRMRERIEDVPFEVHLESIMRGAEELTELVHMRRTRKNDEIGRWRHDDGRPGEDPMQGKEYMLDAPPKEKAMPRRAISSTAR